MTQQHALALPWLDAASLYQNSFRLNVKALASASGVPVPVENFAGLTCWLLPLPGPAATLQLHLYEERLDDHAHAACDQCRIIGNSTARKDNPAGYLCALYGKLVWRF